MLKFAHKSNKFGKDGFEHREIPDDKQIVRKYIQEPGIVRRWIVGLYQLDIGWIILNGVEDDLVIIALSFQILLFTFLRMCTVQRRTSGKSDSSE